jgi:riboflavin kinase/FMN adenylyltransferase
LGLINYTTFPNADVLEEQLPLEDYPAMKIYRNLDEFTPLQNAVVTIGTFDGVHIGHQKILKKLVDCAQKTGGESVLLTFFPHPRLIINPDDEALRLINDIEEKTHQLA